MVTEAAERQKEEPQALEAVVKQCGTCSHWRFMGDKLAQGAWGFCCWEEQDILMLIPYWMFHKRNMYVSTNYFEGSDCGAWKDKRDVDRSGMGEGEELEQRLYNSCNVSAATCYEM